MKKALVMLLAVILVVGMAVPAYAVSSPVGEESSDTTTADVPEIVEPEVPEVSEEETDTAVKVELVPVTKVEDLPESAAKTFVAAQETLKEAAPKGMKTQYFCYVTIDKPDEVVTTDKTETDGEKTDTAEAPKQSVTMTIKIANVTKVVVKQFIDGKWIELKAVLNEDGTVTIFDVVEGPIAVFTE